MSSVPNADEERSRLSNERVAVERQYASARAVCYKYFDVNRCLADARHRQSESLTEIKRQERLLNADERRSKAAAQVQKLEERSSLQNLESLAADRNQRAGQNADRLVRSTSKVVGQPQSAPRGLPENKSPNLGNASARSTPNAKTIESQKNLANFNEKQREAADHRADVEKRRKARTSPLAAPLQPLSSDQ